MSPSSSFFTTGRSGRGWISCLPQVTGVAGFSWAGAARGKRGPAPNGCGLKSLLVAPAGSRLWDQP